MSQFQINYQSFNQGNMEPMQIDIGPEEIENGDQIGRIIESSSLDLEILSTNYKGLARLYRLIHIADHCQSLKVEALKMAITHVMATNNTQLYQSIHKKLQEAINSQMRLPDAISGLGATTMPALDTQWIESTNKKAAIRLEKLDIDLKSCKSNSIKDSIRRGFDDLGDHYLDCGDLSNALKNYSRTRDYCTNSKQIVNMCTNVIKVSVYLQNWSHVLSYVNKAETTPYINELGKDANQQVLTKLRVAAGLAEMVGMKYKSAAKSFLQANFDHVDFPELLSANNIATYGALCALATFDRQELQRLVISSGTFKLFLELEPQLRDIINYFYNSKYASCLKLLADIKDNLLLDLYLANHVDRLYSEIRSKALCQYFSPYKSADMRKMAVAFNTTVAELEDELMKLIMDAKISARIDSHNKVLYAKDTDQRNATFGKLIEIGEENQRRTKALIIRSALIKNQLMVKSPPRDGNQGIELSLTPGIALKLHTQ